METQEVLRSVSRVRAPFREGESVVYGLHGKLKVVKIERRGEEKGLFYCLQALRRGAVGKEEPAIWVKVEGAEKQGLRKPLDASQVPLLYEWLHQKHPDLDWQQPWSGLTSLFDALLKSEGVMGLAKASLYFLILQQKKRLLTAPAELLRLKGKVEKLFFRELADALEITPKAAEDWFQKNLRSIK